MRFITFYLFLSIAYTLSVLPFWLLYRLSDLFYFFIYYVFQYRKKVVLLNLKRSFPGKSQKEIGIIAKDFYLNFCDVIVECIKMLTISQKAAVKRCRFLNPEVLDELHKNNTSAIAVVAHYCNWELGGLSLAVNCRQQVVAIYKPLSNLYFNKIINKIRNKFGTQLVSMENIARSLVKNKQKTTLNVFITDQSPANVEACHWMNFLNQNTPVYLGTEKLAKSTNYPVVFLSMQRVKRGYYTVEVLKIADNPKEMKAFEITEKHTRILEDIIHNRPANWLWSHRRWKRKRSVN